MTIARLPATAAELAAEVSRFGPVVDAGRLGFARPLPAELRPVVRVLHTGVRAVLAGLTWYGMRADGRGAGPGRDGALNPAAVLPWDVCRVCVAGDSRWDVVLPRSHTLHPTLFGLLPAATAVRQGLAVFEGRRPTLVGLGGADRANQE